MKVLGTKLLLKVEKSEGAAQKIGNLVIPVGNDKDYETAEVIEVGKDLKDEEVSKGDKVYIYPQAGKVIYREGVEYRVITVNDIIVVL